MATMIGVVQKVKSVVRGQYNFIEFMIAGTWYTIKYCDLSPVQEGENVQFNFETKVNGKFTNMEVDKKSIIKVAASVTPTAPVAVETPVAVIGQVAVPKAAANYAKAQEAKDAYWANKEIRDLSVQKIIQYQAARNAAIEVVKIAQAAGVLELPKTKNKQLESIVSLVETLADSMFLTASDVTRLDSLKELNGEVAVHNISDIDVTEDVYA